MQKDKIIYKYLIASQNEAQNLRILIRIQNSEVKYQNTYHPVNNIQVC